MYGPRGGTVTGKQKPGEHSSAGGRRAPKVRSGSDGSDRSLDPSPALKFEITVSEVFVFPPPLLPTPEPPGEYWTSFPLENLICRQSLRCHRCDSELFRSCFLKNVIMVGTRAHSSGAGVGKPAQSLH